MSKVGRNRKGLRWGTKPDRKTPWKPAVATHQVRYMIVKDKYGREDYKPMMVQKEGAQIEKGPNRAQRRKDQKWEKGQIQRDRKNKIKDNFEIGKIAKQKRIEKQAEENRQKSAKRRELAKKK